MPRKWKPNKYGIKPDPLYGNELASKFVNSLMWDGKKATAEKVFYQALARVGDKLKEKPPLDVFLAACEHIKPLVEVKSRRVGGATYQVPVEVSRRRQQALAIRWIIESARGKKGRPMAEKLADELLDAHNRTGAAWTKRENVHKMAEANKAFAHYAW